MQTLLIGGNAGQGIDLTTGILIKLLKSAGYKVFRITDAMARIEYGHCFSIVGFGRERFFSTDNRLDILLAFDDDTIARYSSDLKPDGLIICGASTSLQDRRIFRLTLPCIIGEAGLAHVEGCYAIGAVARLLEMRLDNLHHILKTMVLEQYQNANIKAAARGYDFVSKHLQKPRRSGKELVIIAGLKEPGSVSPKTRVFRPVVKSQYADLAQQR